MATTIALFILASTSLITAFDMCVPDILECQYGFLCVNSECVPPIYNVGCYDRCKPDETCVMGSCISNGNNCNNQCGAFERCANGVCVSNAYNCPGGCRYDSVCLLGRCVSIGFNCRGMCVNGEKCERGICVAQKRGYGLVVSND